MEQIKYFLVIFLLLEASVICLAQSCTDLEKEELFDAVNLCTKQPKVDFQNSLENVGSEQEMFSVLCNFWVQEAVCLNKDLKDCYTSTQITNINDNLMLRHFEFAYNNSKLFGQRFIDACPLIRDLEDYLVVKLSGTNNCNFMEYEGKGRQFVSCLDEAHERFKLQVQLSSLSEDPLSTRLTAFCTMHNTIFNSCLQPLKTCLSAEKYEREEDTLKGAFEISESDIQETIPDFSLDEYCSA